MNLDQDFEWQVAQTLAIVYSRHALAATLTIAILEYLELFPLEKALIWASKWGIAKTLFLISRYYPLCCATMLLYYTSAPLDTSPTVCKKLSNVPTVVCLVGTLCADAILYLRLHALSKQARGLGIVLIINYVVVSLACLVGIALFVHSETFAVSPNLLPGTACIAVGVLINGSAKWITICFGALLYSSLFTTFISLWYGVRTYMEMRPTPPSTLLKTFYKDGVIYFVIIATLSIANTALARFAPLQFAIILSSPQAMLHGVLASRMTLHLREAGQETMIESTTGNPWKGFSVGSASTFRATPKDVSSSTSCT